MKSPAHSKYQHHKEPVEFAEPVVGGSNSTDQKKLEATYSRWVVLTRFEDESDESYQRRLSADDQSFARHRSHLLVSEGGDTSSARLLALVAPKPAIGFSWQTVLPQKDSTALKLIEAKALCIYLNSSIGRVQLRMRAGRKVDYPQLRPVAYKDIPLPDIDSEDVLNVLSECYDKTFDEVVPQFRDGRTNIREKWDDAVSKALDIDRIAIANLAEMLACDAVVNKQSFYASR